MADERIRQPVKITDPLTDANEAGVDASGNLQVIVNAELPTGSNNIGDVDIASFAAADTDADDDIVAVAQTSLRTINLLYGFDSVQWERIMTDGSGSLDVNVTLALPTGSNTIGAVTLAEHGELDNDPVSVNGAILMNGLVFDDTTPVVVTEGDAGYQRMSADREAYTITRDAAGNERGANVTAANELNVIATAQPGVDIGDVDVLSVIPGVGATNLGKAESAVHTTGDTGVGVWGVRVDAETPLAADGQYIPFMMSSVGRLLVETQGGAGGTSETDSDPFTVATTAYVPVGGIFDDVTPGDLTEGDGGAVRMSAVREMYTNIRDGAGGERSANVTAANELNVIATAQPGVDIGDVDIASFPAGDLEGDDDSIAFAQTSLRSISLMHGSNGSEWERITTNGTGAMDVNVVAGGGEAVPDTPVRLADTEVDTAAGAIFNVDSATMDGLTRTVRGFTASASVPIKASLVQVDNDVETIHVTLFARAGEGIIYKAPHRDFHEVTFGSTGGFDGFRIAITNLDNTQAADTHGTLFTES
jgi:hypothetical protein